MIVTGLIDDGVEGTGFMPHTDESGQPKRCCDWYERVEATRTTKALYAALERVPCADCNRHLAESEVPEHLRAIWQPYVAQSSPRRMPRALGFWLYRNPSTQLAHSS
jgi:hypothetical protein